MDVGSRRIGLAISDGLGITAQPLETLTRRNNRTDLAALGGIIGRYGVREVVMGLPLYMSGDESPQSKKVREFAAMVTEKLGVSVRFIDERLTSAQAHRLLDEAELSRMERKGKVDKIAAVLILENFLARRGTGV